MTFNLKLALNGESRGERERGVKGVKWGGGSFITGLEDPCGSKLWAKRVHTAPNLIKEVGVLSSECGRRRRLGWSKIEDLAQNPPLF